VIPYFHSNAGGEFRCEPRHFARPKIAPDPGKPPVNLAGGLHKARYTTVARPLVRFHDPPIVSGSRLFRLCF
jgi:hypothetical protein